MMGCDVDSLVSVWNDVPPTPRSQVKYLSIEDVLTFQEAKSRALKSLQ
jgi:hypothetical protein